MKKKMSVVSILKAMDAVLGGPSVYLITIVEYATTSYGHESIAWNPEDRISKAENSPNKTTLYVIINA